MVLRFESEGSGVAEPTGEAEALLALVGDFRVPKLVGHKLLLEKDRLLALDYPGH